MSNEQIKISPAALKKAKAICAVRFRFANTEHPAMKALLALSARRAAEQFETSPDSFPEQQIREAMQAAKEPQKPIDPVDLLQEDIKLPTLPTVFVELQKVIKDENSSSNDLARVISKDGALSALLLRIVNSAFYNFRSQIDTISRAVTIVGTKQLSTLAMGGAIMRLFKELPDQTIDIQNYWRHSIAVAVIGRIIATNMRVDDPEPYFVAGLLHDIGRLAIFNARPEDARKIVKMSHNRGIPMYEAEQGALGFNHGKFGGMLLRKWNLPFNLVMSVLHHHSPSKAGDALPPSIIHMADIIAKSIGYSATEEYYVPPLDDEAWKIMGFKPKDLRSIIEEVDMAVEEAVSQFMPESNVA